MIRKGPQRVFFKKDGQMVDVGAMIDTIKPVEPDDTFMPGLKDVTVTITGRWLSYNDRVCYVCQEVFSFGPEGPYQVTEHERGITIDACPRCAIALVDPERP